jgi:hypothetical protein
MIPSAMISGAAVSTIRVQVELRTAASASSGALGSAIATELSTAIQHLCQTLGIPGETSIELSTLGVAATPESLLRFWVNGARVRYPKTMLSRAHSYVTGKLPDPDTGAVLGWFQQVAVSDAAQFVTWVAAAAIKQTPSVLFGDAAAIAFLELLRTARLEYLRIEPERLRTIVAPAFDAGMSIVDVSKVAALLEDLCDRPIVGVQQALMDRLARPEIEIRMPGEFLREMTADESRRTALGLPLLRNVMFEDLGLTLPNIVFARDDSLRDRNFAFRINDLVTEPIVGLAREQLLVNDSAERIRQAGIGAEEALHPNPGQTACAISERNGHAVRELGWTTCDAPGYLTLCLAQALRSRVASLITVTSVRKALDQLRELWPLAVDAASDEVGDHTLTAVLQNLVAHGISIHDLSVILERIIDREYCVTEASALAVLDEYPPPVVVRNAQDIQGLIRFVRAGLRRQITNLRARQTTTVVVYLLDPEIEDLLSAPEALSESEEDRILNAIRSELAHLPPIAQIPNLLTRSDARPMASALVAKEFPQMAVLAYDELAPEANVMPVARISLAAK